MTPASRNQNFPEARPGRAFFSLLPANRFTTSTCLHTTLQLGSEHKLLREGCNRPSCSTPLIDMTLNGLVNGVHLGSLVNGADSPRSPESLPWLVQKFGGK